MSGEIRGRIPTRTSVNLLAFTQGETKQTGSSMSDPAPPVPVSSPEEIDPAVIRLVASGDVEAFARVYDGFSGVLYTLALRMLQRPEDAEELMQEVFLKIWNDAGRYDAARGAPLAWAIIITRNKAIDRIRSITRRRDLHEAAGPPPAEDTLSARAAENREAARAVQSSVASLPADVRETIELAYFGGLSHSEIAQKLSLPLTTVKSRIRRAMMQLRQTLRHHA